MEVIMSITMERKALNNFFIYHLTNQLKKNFISSESSPLTTTSCFSTKWQAGAISIYFIFQKSSIVLNSIFIIIEKMDGVVMEISWDCKKILEDEN